jgi:glutamine synthetase
MAIATAEDANKLLKSAKVRWVQVQFTDIDGRLKAMSSPVEDYLSGRAWAEGISFDGSSVHGYMSVKYSDMIAMPDPSTLLVLPWGEGVQRRASVLAFFKSPDGKPLETDPRRVAASAMARARSMGFKQANMFPELEFFLFSSPGQALEENEFWHRDVNFGPGAHTKVLEPASGYVDRAKRGYLLPAPNDSTEDFRNEFSSALADIGLDIRYHHHEAGSRQVEIEFRFLPSPQLAADASVRYRYFAKAIAAKYGLVPTFMPKPIFADAGSGMHVHQYLSNGGPSLFWDKDDPNGLSQTALYYIGGILEHARGMALVTNSSINSYKRLVPEFEAPIFAAWSPMNRSALVRIPYVSNPKTTRIEARHGDALSNPYLAHAVMLWCGLDGIKRKIDPGPAIKENIYKLTEEKRKSLGIKRMPAHLREAYEAFREDTVVQECLGKQLSANLMDAKLTEWRQFCAHVTPWEHYQYFDA